MTCRCRNCPRYSTCPSQRQRRPRRRLCPTCKKQAFSGRGHSTLSAALTRRLPLTSQGRQAENAAACQRGSSGALGKCRHVVRSARGLRAAGARERERLGDPREHGSRRPRRSRGSACWRQPSMPADCARRSRMACGLRRGSGRSAAVKPKARHQARAFVKQQKYYSCQHTSVSMTSANTESPDRRLARRMVLLHYAVLAMWWTKEVCWPDAARERSRQQPRLLLAGGFSLNGFAA